MSNIAPLCEAWLAAKAAEAKANRERLAIEAQLAEAVEIPAEGTRTQKIDGFKIAASQPMYRKVDAEAWARVRDRISRDLWPVKVKIEADAAGMKYLANNEPDLWKEIAEAFTTTPGKVVFQNEREETQ